MSRAAALENTSLQLDSHDHQVSKRRIRKKLIRDIRRSVPLDLVDAALVGLRGR